MVSIDDLKWKVIKNKVVRLLKVYNIDIKVYLYCTSFEKIMNFTMLHLFLNMILDSITSINWVLGAALHLAFSGMAIYKNGFIEAGRIRNYF